MKFVHEEIRYFGGDPKQVTLVGNSAGAVMIIHLSVSPSVPREYYSKAIISSGIAGYGDASLKSASDTVIKKSGVSISGASPEKIWVGVGEKSPLEGKSLSRPKKFNAYSRLSATFKNLTNLVRKHYKPG